MKDMIKRYFFFILGLIINSFGIAFITKSALGTSPISSVPYVRSVLAESFIYPAAAYQPGNRLRDPGLRHLRGSSP